MFQAIVASEQWLQPEVTCVSNLKQLFILYW